MTIAKSFMEAAVWDEAFVVWQSVGTTALFFIKAV